MLSRVWYWAKRHRRKLALTVALAGGVWYASRWFSSGAAQLRAQQLALTRLAEARRAQHLDITLRNADLTTLNLLPRLLEQLDALLDVATLTAELKAAGAAGDKRAAGAMLAELKRRSVSRAVAAVLCAALLGSLVRLQLAVLAGYLYHADKAAGRPLSEEVQSRYLALLEQALPDSAAQLCTLVLTQCRAVLDPVPLKERLTLRGLDGLLHRLRLQLEPGLAQLMSVQLRPPADEAQLSVSEQLTLQRLCSETNELLGSQDYLAVNRALLDTLFAVLLDFLAAHFEAVAVAAADGESGASRSVPLMKLLPVVAAVPAVVLSDAPDNVFVRESANCVPLRVFAANVYTAFSEPVSGD